MQTSSMLKDLLLISNPKVMGLCEYLNQSALLFILPAFYMAIIFEFFNQFDFEGVAKRAFIAFLAIKMLSGFHIEAVNLSLETSSALISKYSPNNKFLSAYQVAIGDAGSIDKTGVWAKLTSIVKMLVDDQTTLSIFLTSYFSFFLLTQLYSLSYHLTLAMIGVCAVLSIFPLTSGSLKGAVKSIFWCMLMPFVVAIILCLIGDSDVFFKTYTGGIVQNLESLIQLLILMVILLLSPLITSKLMIDSGVTHVAENLGQMAGMAALMGAVSTTSKFVGSKAMNTVSSIHNNTTRPMINSMKSNLSDKAFEISKNKGINSSITKNNPIDKLKGKLGDTKEVFKNTTLKEKAILGADSIFNKQENTLAKNAMIDDYKKYSSKPSFENKKNVPTKIPVANYKLQAGKFLRERDELINRPKMASDYDQFKSNEHSIRNHSKSHLKNNISLSQPLKNQLFGVSNANSKNNVKIQNQRRGPEGGRFFNV